MPLIIQKNYIVSYKSKQQLVNIKSDRQTYGSVYIVSQSGKAFFNLNSFFAPKNHLYPISISKNEQIQQWKTKLDLLACLYAIVESSLETPDVDVKLVDWAAFVNINLPGHSKTHREYCDAELTERISNISRDIDRFALVFEIYGTKSSKSQTIISQGKIIRVSVRKKTLVHYEFNVVIRDKENKNGSFWNDCKWFNIIQLFKSVNYCNQSKKCLCNKQKMQDELQPCNYEEANYRLLLHKYDVSQKRFRKLSIITIDTEVVVIKLHHFFFHFISMSCWSNLVVNMETISNTCNYMLFRERILMSNTILLCFNWFWHSFVICWERKTNCVPRLGMLLWSNKYICEVFSFVY